uniref:Zinc finger GRF-type domain-containing protein n=1 Tax=Lactuca sativa TaxID=4236 RepID=A0A9R1XTQ9_LACSA|nr:hypothetical protein LSAT_V11C100000570 [Lactuca sativa]
MPTFSTKSSSNVNSRNKKKVDVKCRCEDVLPVFVSCTLDNPCNIFWGFPNYKVEGGCGFFKWVDNQGVQKLDMMAESNEFTEQGKVTALMQMVFVLLVSILCMFVLVVYKI